ncbi:MAG: TonB-dependent receptor [Candidatus Neomarinimicrobiota bacterium]|nr:TonB-dependent receptor [Candidatus Neomarinimicrobiota bacterium]
MFKSKKKKIICACCAMSVALQAQNLTVSGTVKSIKSNEPLQSANVAIENTDLGTFTDENGRFIVKDIQSSEVSVKISMIGFVDTTLSVSTKEKTYDLGEIKLRTDVLQLSNINVHAHDNLIQPTLLSDVFLSGKEMQEKMYGSIAQTLQNEIGIAIQSMGQATTRPILRGYSGDRFLITKNGVKTGDLSHSSADHAMSLDLGGVERIEVFRGPRALLFGSNTIGGVVNVEKNSLSSQRLNESRSYFTSGIDSGNKGLFSSYSIESPWRKNNIRFSIQNRKTNNQITPKGVLENTAINNTEGFLGISRIGDDRRATFSFERVLMDYGIPGSPEGHINGVDLKLSKNTQELNYHQDIDFRGFETLNIDQSFIFYSHSEYESSSSSPAVRLSQNILSLKTNLVGRTKELGNSIDIRYFSAGGFYWTPNTTEIKMSLFGLQENELLGFSTQLSFRAEQSFISPEVKTKFSNLEVEDVVNKQFSFISFAGSAIREWQNWQWSNTIMRTGKTPDIESLYSDGPHLGSYSYEIGNPYLELEKTLGFESSLQYAKNRFSLLLNGYYNQSPSYHQYLKNGDGYKPGADWIEWGCGAAGWLYIYEMKGVKSEINGGEIQVAYLGKNIDIDADFSFVRGLDKTNNTNLSFMPADKFQLTLSTKESRDLTASIRFTKGFEQSRLGEFETITPGYYLIDIYGSYSFGSSNGNHRLVFNVNNILDEEYYNHLSKIKTIMPEFGRRISLQYRYLF